MSKQSEIYYESSLLYSRCKNVSAFYFIQVIRPIRDIHALRLQDKQSIEIKIYNKVILYLKKNSFVFII